MLTRTTRSVASVDGLKAGLLSRAYMQLLSSPYRNIFNVMGHPKELSSYSLARVEQFLDEYRPKMEPVTFQELVHLPRQLIFRAPGIPQAELTAYI